MHTDQSLHLPASVLTIGALDGVHRGHQTLIAKARTRAQELGVPLVVYTFDPPPKVFFSNALALTSLAEKVERLKLLEVDHIVVAPFNTGYLNRNAESFLDELANLNPMEIWAGPDFRFGKNKQGDLATLRNRFSVHVLEPICCGQGTVISSSRIRLLIKKDQIIEAEQLLGWQTLYRVLEKVK
ncbi:FAD synthetase [Neobacillus sp. LXY-4]|uniref:FAD synthetase n=1 Tax=Neobacillus sp. LXY-4 TaxID=3379826 RepID=UPI003EE34FA2